MIAGIHDDVAIDHLISDLLGDDGAIIQLYLILIGALK